MQLVEHEAAERPEQIGRIRGREQQRQLLRRGQEHVRRMAALALTF
jgi:predicted transposase YdaD